MPRPPSEKIVLIYEDLLGQIATGKLSFGHQLPPEKTLAAQYGVAGLTLRKALQRLREEGWIVSQRYHGTRISHPEHPLRPHKMIGLVLHKTASLSHPVFTRFANGVEGILSEAGYAMELAVSNPEHSGQEKSLLAKIADPTIDGWLIPTTLSASAEKAFAALNKPKVLLHKPNAEISPHCLVVDYMALAMDTLQHLGRNKYRRIWVVGPSVQQGFLESLKLLADSSLTPKGLKIFVQETEDFQMESTRHACRQILQDNKVDAFICYDDELAIGAMKALTELGLSAPRIGIVGGGDFPIGSITSPPLTTIHYPYYQVGRDAARLLLDLIERKPVEEGDRRFSARLVERQSTQAIAPAHSATARR